MRCPKCQTENPETRKFCRKCGTKLIIACSKCGFENLPDDLFCGECGTPLTAPTQPIPKPSPSFDEKIARVQHYLPKELAEKILAQRERIEGERKQVTVLFTDMAGYTSMSEKLDPEEAFGLMEQVYEILIRTVNEYGGTVNELTGDGVMALFGAPIALEDAPQRAIRASLAIHREMVQFNDKMRREKAGLPVLRMRAGINTGPVVVGTLGNDLRVELKVAGDTVNLASRMEGLAEPGSTYLTEDTFKLTEGLFRFEGLGEKAIKGKEKPIRIYRVIAPSTSRTRFDVSAERGLTPFVGRERERELLLDAFERARQGRGQAVSIVSEAGMGKSRLLYEFRKAVLNEDITFLEGKCLSFSRSEAYQPISDILKSNFDIREGDWDPVIRKKVTQGLQALSVEEDPALPYLLELLSVKDSGIEKIQLSPEGKKEKTFETIKKIVLKGSEMRPLILAIEDLHWIDKTSEEAMKYLLESIPGAKILLILTYRPEFIPTWGARSYHNQLLLNRLSNRESLFMATHILCKEQIPPVPPLLKGDIEVKPPMQKEGIEFGSMLKGNIELFPPFLKGGGGDFGNSLGTVDMETALEEVILEKTEGIPFFIEEFIKSLKDLGFIERKDNVYRISKELQAVRIPSTIQDIIMARVDALPEGAKELLQVGSLIEREFSYKLIKAAMHLPEEELLRRLSILKDAELLYERGLFPNSSFVFKHALTREVVSDTLLARKRKEIHTEIGQAMEAVYKDTLDERYSILAEHFMEGGEYGKAAEYCRLASKTAEKRASMSEAISQAKKRVDAIERLPKSAETEKLIIDARVALGNYHAQVSNDFEAKEAVEPALELAIKHDNKRRTAQIYAILGTFQYSHVGDFSKAMDYYERAMKLAEEVHDLLSIWSASHWSGHIYADNCEFDKALYQINRALEINQMANVLWGVAIMNSCLALTVYHPQGKIELAYQTSQEALRMAEKSGDLFSRTDCHISHGRSSFYKGNLDDAEALLTVGLSLAESASLRVYSAYASISLAMVFAAKKQYGKSLRCCEKALASFGERHGSNMFLLMTALFYILDHRGEPDLDDLRKFLHGVKPRIWEGISKSIMAQVLMNMGQFQAEEAERWLKEAIECDAKNKMMWQLADDHAVYAEWFKWQNRIPEARESLTKSIAIFRDCGADGWVKKYEEELAGL